MSEALRSVAVFGGGVVALSAAIAFARALPRTAITLIETPVDPAAFADRLPVVWPSSAAMLDRLGLDEPMLIARGTAIPRLAQRFTDWSRDGRPWLVDDDTAISVPGPGQIHQRWLDAVRQGSTLPFHALLPGAMLAEAGHSGMPDQVDAALRLDPVAIGALLKGQLPRARVRTGRGMIAGVDRDGSGRIVAVRLVGGTAITADLFVDATGPAALLGEAGDFTDWSTTLPCDRLLIMPDRDATASPLDDYRATDIGWSARWSWPGGAMHALGYAAAVTADDHARRTMTGDRAGAILIGCRPGRRRHGWTTNVLALGEAAVQPGPLAHAGLTLALAQLALALDLLPRRDMEPLLIAEYNRRAASRADRLHDYLAAFYLGRAGNRGPFWQALDGRTPPAGLAATLTWFARRGLVPQHDEESVPPAAWHAVLLGQGIRPERRDPVSMATDPATNLAAVQGAADALRAAVARLSATRS